ncbi:MAG: hypothetical protein AB7O24_13345 [Kofleriaceae bacterium]
MTRRVDLSNTPADLRGFQPPVISELKPALFVPSGSCACDVRPSSPDETRGSCKCDVRDLTREDYLELIQLRLRLNDIRSYRKSLQLPPERVTGTIEWGPSNAQLLADLEAGLSEADYDRRQAEMVRALNDKRRAAAERSDSKEPTVCETRFDGAEALPSKYESRARLRTIQRLRLDATEDEIQRALPQARREIYREHQADVERQAASAAARHDSSAFAATRADRTDEETLAMHARVAQFLDGASHE